MDCRVSISDKGNNMPFCGHVHTESEKHSACFPNGIDLFLPFILFLWQGAFTAL
jgi:hypothetical protein